MLSLQTRIDVSNAKALFGDKMPKAMPYVKAAMLSRLASGGREEVQKQMPLDFDKPTDFTVRGVRYEGAKPRVLQARVYIPESQDAAGKAPREYMQPGVAGSQRRRQKRSELLLTRAGYLPAGWVTRPGKAAVLNAEGNLPAPVYKQIVNVLQLKRVETKTARGISERSQKRAKKMGVDTEWFAVKPGKNTLAKGGGWLPPGVYRRTGSKGETMEQILRFVRKAAYRPRLDFAGTVREYVVKNAQAAWNASASSVFQKFNTPKT